MTRAKRVWIEGLLQAFWSGIGGVFAVMVVDPGTFNFTQFAMLAKVSGLAAAVSVVRFLMAKPLPPGDDGDDGDNPPRPIAEIARAVTGTGDGK